MRQDLVVPQLIKQGQRIFSVSTPDTQLFAISATEKKLNNLQKQQGYKTENSECA